MTQEERDIAIEERQTWLEETGRAERKPQIFDASTISIYKGPEIGDKVRFADGSLWTLEHRGMKWGLYDNENGVLHSAIGLHPGMLDLCASVNSQDRFVSDLMQRSTAADSLLRGEAGTLEAISKMLS